MNTPRDDQHSARILAVDDEPSVCEIIKLMLEGENYVIDTFTDGHRALRALRTSEYDLLICDLNMPGIDGLALLKCVRAEDTRLPVVICTAQQDARTAMELLLAGANDYIVKPFDRGDILRTVKRTLEHRRLMDENERYRRELELAVRELETLAREKDRLTEMIVHDLKNPLAITMGRLDLLRLNADGFDERTLRNITYAQHACQEILTMIGDLLDVSRFETGADAADLLTITDIDLNQLLADTLLSWGPVIEANGTRLELSVPFDLPEVRADRDLLARVLSNLISNAAAHGGSNGRINLRAEARGPQAVVTVADSGMGVPAEWRERIFDKYAQVEARRQGKRAARGLGLTFCRYAVEAMGGKIWVESEPGQGARFRFSLPVSEPLEVVVSERELETAGA